MGIGETSMDLPWVAYLGRHIGNEDLVLGSWGKRRIHQWDLGYPLVMSK